MAGRSKAELIRCETHGAFRQTGKKEGGKTRRKERLQTREGQRESNWKHVLSTCPIWLSVSYLQVRDDDPRGGRQDRSSADELLDDA